MNNFSRRQFLQAAGAATACAALPRAASAATASGRVVVVGGGFGGATVAKYLRLWGGDVQVTLVEPNPTHIACILSNLVLTGALSMNRITLGYSALQTNHGVSLMQGRAIAIDPPGQRLTVQTATGQEWLDYDHLVLAPGIDFAPAPGLWDTNLTPHAWQAGEQTTRLKNQIAAMRNGDRFVMTVPKSPYRCPPGPYERACVVADYLKAKRRTGAKVIVLDANPSIQAEPEAFGQAFSVTHRSVIQYVPNAQVQSIDSASRSIVTSAGTISNATVLNYIPNQRAGAIAAALGVNSTGFVPVNPLTYATAIPTIHVIGDSCAVPASDGKAVPKSGHMANSEAKVCADAILRALNGEAADQNIATSSACYSPITARTASWLSANFIYGDIYDANGAVKGKGMHRLDIGEAPRQRVNNDSYKEMFTWADSLFADSFV
ncbi:MAG: NAD(P)/FAD-dependent oxidoreductase [Sulfuritalea sp.]|nr:NAD(P)/FAD-dependent oxidoreductase [Sulfuritalea sp.]